MRVAGITGGFLEEVVFPTHADLSHKLYDPKESVGLQGTISSSGIYKTDISGLVGHHRKHRGLYFLQGLVRVPAPKELR